MDKVRRGKYRKKLEQEYQDLMALLSSQAESERETEDRTPEDAVDQAANSYAKEFWFRQSGSERAQLQLIEEALSRVDSEEFGLCLNCGAAIGAKRLDAVPWARFCRECQEREEKQGDSENGYA